MDADIYPSDEYESDGVPIPYAGLATPRDVLADRAMPTEDKRALLVSWASDLRAVENCPSLRRLVDGTELHLDDILEALKSLDSLGDRDTRQRVVVAFPSSRLCSWPKRDEDDDDDPPPVAMAMRLPRSGQQAVAMPFSANQWRPSAVVGE